MLNIMHILGPDIYAELTTEGPTVAGTTNIATTTANKGMLLIAVRGFGKWNDGV